MKTPRFFVVVAVLASACAPQETQDGDPVIPDATCDATAPARSPLRRLTHPELHHTLVELLHVDDPGVLDLLPPESLGGFSNNTDVRSVGADTATAYDALAERLAADIVSDPRPLLGCELASDGCVEGWLPGFIEQAFRRPVAPERAERLMGLYRSAKAEWGPADALDVTLQVLFQSPEFLYRVEPTALRAAPGEVVTLDGYEMANRLSYFLWASPPDAALRAAAASGALDTAEGIESHARRMLEDPRAERAIFGFFREWMDLQHLEEVEKDPALHGDFTDEIRHAYEAEVEAFIGEVWNTEDASFEVLLTASWTMADVDLATWYGLPAPTESGFQRIERDSAYHAGFFTQGAFLASRARPYESSPVHRGMFFRGNLLCESMRPPTGLDITPPDPDPNLTTRERLAQHRADPSCAGCHDKLDPPGFALEHFDAVGRFRDSENGKAIDATGDLAGTDKDGPFDGANELAWMLVESEDVQRCFGRQWFRYAHGRTDDKGRDACAVGSAVQAFTDSKLDMRELIIATTTTRAFRSAIGAPEGT
ncbi:MAG: DUF1592 domain-containing protein [Myxococcota bacterium]